MVREEKPKPKSSPTHRPTEVERCRWLRRVDWRFLIDDGSLGSVVTTASGDLWHALNLVAANVSRPGAANTDFDVAVAVDPPSQDLTALWLELKAGGTLFAEWRTARPFGQSTWLKRVAAAGFADVRSYWAWPPFHQDNPRVWLPLDAPHAVRHYLAQQSAELRSQAAMRLAWMLLWKLGWLAGICVLAKKSEPSAGAYPMPVRILLTRGAAASNKVVALEFNASSKQPDTATKHARVPESHPGLINEANVLSALNTEPPLPGVPRLVAVEQSPSTVSVTETALSGVALDLPVIRRRFLAIAQAATDWLIALAQRTLSAPSPAHQDDYVDDAVAAFQRVLPDCVSHATLLDATQRRLKTLGSLLRVAEQRDFSPWNVFLNPHGGCTVFDWESAVLKGMPGLDLIYFLTHLALFRSNAMDQDRSLAAYIETWDPRSQIGGIVHESLHRYGSGVGTDLDWDALRLLTWVIHAPNEQYRRERSGQVGDGPLMRFFRFEQARLIGGAAGRTGPRTA